MYIHTQVCLYVNLDMINIRKYKIGQYCTRSTSESACEGAGSQVATCWSGQACAATRDIRTDICFRQASHLIPQLQTDGKKISTGVTWSVRSFEQPRYLNENVFTFELIN